MSQTSTAANSGISQFIDIGAGLPAVPSVHHIVWHADPGARVVYADNDPVVVAHARALLAGPGVAVVAAEMRQPHAIVAALTGRTESEIASYFTGLDLLPPGLTDVQAWRPARWASQPRTAARILGATGRKPVG